MTNPDPEYSTKTGHDPDAVVIVHPLFEFTLKSGRVVTVVESRIEGHAPNFVIKSRPARHGSPFHISIPQVHVRDLRAAIDEFLARDDGRAHVSGREPRELPTHKPTPPTTGRGTPRGKVTP